LQSCEKQIKLLTLNILKSNYQDVIGNRATV